MALIFNLSKVILANLADLEFQLFTQSNNKLNTFRRLHLKLMQVRFEQQFFLGHDIYIRNRGNLTLGNRCCIGSYSRIWNYAPIMIGDDFLTAGCITFNSATHDSDTLEPKGMPIVIGDRVWCGINVTIIGGVTIGNDVVIGAGSVVVKDIPSGCIAAGVPAKKIKDLNRENVKIWKPFNWS
jgi:maltose O-acetyltransferase